MARLDALDVRRQTFGVALSLTIAPSTTPSPAAKPIDVRRGRPRAGAGAGATDIPLANIQMLTPVPPEQPESEDA